MAGTAISPSYAQEEARHFTENTAKVVNETMIFANIENYEAAINDLQNLLNDSELKAYEQGVIFQMIGQYSYELGRMEASQSAFEKAIESGGLLPDEVDNLKVVVAQLMVGNGQFQEGAARLENYLAEGGEEKPQYVELLVNARVQAEDYAGALPWAEKWFQDATPKTRKHYDLLNFLYNNLGLQDEQLRLIKEMIDEWPQDKNLWQSWISILAKSGREGEAFEVHKMMYQAGLLTAEKELLKTVQYYDYYDMPYEAAKFLDREIEAGRISGTSDNLMKTASFYRQAREPERAIPFLEAAAKLSGNMDLKLELGEALSTSGACEKAEIAFETAISQGYDTDKAFMLIGNCYVDRSEKLGQISCNMTDVQRQKAPFTRAREAALKAFKAVPKKSRESGNAKKWMQFIEAEIQADERRCRHDGRNVERELCYQKIKQAYDASIFTEVFILDDKSCDTYIDDYNAEFRLGSSTE